MARVTKVVKMHLNRSGHIKDTSVTSQFVTNHIITCIILLCTGFKSVIWCGSHTMVGLPVVLSKEIVLLRGTWLIYITSQLWRLAFYFMTYFRPYCMKDLPVRSISFVFMLSPGPCCLCFVYVLRITQQKYSVGCHYSLAGTIFANSTM